MFYITLNARGSESIRWTRFVWTAQYQWPDRLTSRLYSVQGDYFLLGFSCDRHTEYCSFVFLKQNVELINCCEYFPWLFQYFARFITARRYA